MSHEKSRLAAWIAGEIEALSMNVDMAEDDGLSQWERDDLAELNEEYAAPQPEAGPSAVHWAASNPGLADQYRAEALACRRALGFDANADDVAPVDLTNAIARQLSAAQVPDARRMLLDEVMEGVTPCSDGGCLVRVGPAKGMHTNGGCKCCRKPEMQRVLYRIKQARETALSAQPQEQSATDAGESGKPPWKDAPEWAQWLAQNADGDWYWYADKPRIFVTTSRWASSRRWKHGWSDIAGIGKPDPNWRATIEQRPAGADGGEV